MQAAEGGERVGVGGQVDVVPRQSLLLPSSAIKKIANFILLVSLRYPSLSPI